VVSLILGSKDIFVLVVTSFCLNANKDSNQYSIAITVLCSKEGKWDFSDSWRGEPFMDLI
jgi:hypothetical protein